ncbi:DUF1080 domain-containing protein [Luteolibacter ambystomatis]|uniref:3-keto-disaccharide hydrolase n=1 Tax=Luteolibacter ambystomatis TaxID=2824561 RepID=UPI001CF7C5B3|nr:DUF1080 domain-containing protein [Luteolibacter ambystomatis]
MKIRLPAILPCALLAIISAAFSADSSAQTELWTPLPASAWHWYGHEKHEGLPPVWTVEADGSLHRAPGNGSWARQDLATDESDYQNFVLELEWKVGKAANSGVFYRIKDGQNQPWPSGFEHQILDDEGFHDGKAPPIHRAGALYSILGPNDGKDLKPPGEWNTTRIVADGRHLEHWLNGKCILKVDLDSPEFKEAFAASEWKGSPAKGAAPNGIIGLQDHGGEVWFRNIRVKKLPVAAK